MTGARSETSSPTQPFVTQELRVVDAEGRPRLVLSAAEGAPVLFLLRDDGRPGATVRLDGAGRPSVTLANPDPDGPGAALEVDGKGTHVRFDRPGGAAAYLFLNNAGGSGVVLIDAQGRRRLSATIGADGSTHVEGGGASPG